MRPSRWRRSTHVVVGVAVLLLVAGLVAVAAVATGGHSSEAAVKPAPPAATAQPGIVPVADSAPKPTPDRLAATLAPVLADPNLGNLTGRITDAMTGAQLWAQGADMPMQPASTNKMLTAAAALLALERDARVTTRVLRVRGRGWWCSSAAATRRCRRRRKARTPGTGTRRGSATLPTRSAQRHRRDRRTGRRQRLQRPDHGAGLGSRRHRRRRHRPDGSGDARRRPHPARQRRVAAVHDSRARCRPRPCGGAQGGSGNRHRAARRDCAAARRSRRCSRRR